MADGLDGSGSEPERHRSHGCRACGRAHCGGPAGRGADLYFIDELFSGFADCAAFCGTRVLGGDTDSHQELTIHRHGPRFCGKGSRASGAGARGWATCSAPLEFSAQGGGLWAWQHGVESEFITSLLEPEPRLKEGRALAKSRAVTAMMDNSDGLALSLSDLSEVSRVGFVVYEEKLLIATGLVEMVGQEKARELVMSAGGDFELVFTVKPEALEAARKACELTVIGEVVDEGIWMERRGERIRVEAKGYEHRIGE